MSKHPKDLLDEIERIADLRRQIPRYKVVAAKHGVSMQTVRRLVHESLRTKIRVHVEHDKVEEAFQELTRNGR